MFSSIHPSATKSSNLRSQKDSSCTACHFSRRIVLHSLRKRTLENMENSRPDPPTDHQEGTATLVSPEGKGNPQQREAEPSSDRAAGQKGKEGQKRKRRDEDCIINFGASAKIRSEIQKLQSGNEEMRQLQIPKAPFLRLVREISMGVCKNVNLPNHFLCKSLKRQNQKSRCHRPNNRVAAPLIALHGKIEKQTPLSATPF